MVASIDISDTRETYSHPYYTYKVVEHVNIDNLMVNLLVGHVVKLIFDSS